MHGRRGAVRRRHTAPLPPIHEHSNGGALSAETGASYQQVGRFDLLANSSIGNYARDHSPLSNALIPPFGLFAFD